jgi:transcriptional regulator with XRE-family HTH domain
LDKQHPIERWRRARGMRQVDLAAKLGTHERTVQTWENGRRPRPHWMPQLAEVLGVDAGQLEADLADWARARPRAESPKPKRRRRIDAPKATGAGD